MDDALLVRRFERLRDLLRDRQRLVERDRRRARSRSASVVARRPVPSPAPDAVGVFEAVDLRDVRMIERRQDLGFALKRARRSGSAANGAGRTLMATSRFERRVTRAIHLAHAAGAEGGTDLIGAEAGTWRNGHRGWCSSYRLRVADEPRRTYGTQPSAMMFVLKLFDVKGRNLFEDLQLPQPERDVVPTASVWATT